MFRGKKEVSATFFVVQSHVHSCKIVIKEQDQFFLVHTIGGCRTREKGSNTSDQSIPPTPPLGFVPVWSIGSGIGATPLAQKNYRDVTGFSHIWGASKIKSSIPSIFLGGCLSNHVSTLFIVVHQMIETKIMKKVLVGIRSSISPARDSIVFLGSY